VPGLAGLAQVSVQVADVRPRPACPGQLDHRPGQVDGVDLRETPGQQHRLPPRPAAEVDGVPAGFRQHVRQPRGDQVMAAQLG
jgi:hypothetical protein